MTVYNIIETKVKNTAVSTTIKGSFVQYDAARIRFQDLVALLKQNDSTNYQRAEASQQTTYQLQNDETYFSYWNVDPLEPFYLVKLQIVETIVFDNTSGLGLQERIDISIKPDIDSEYLRKLYEYGQFTLVMQTKEPKRVGDKEYRIVHSGCCTSFDYNSKVCKALSKAITNIILDK